MNTDRHLERTVASIYEEIAPHREPTGLLDDVLLTTSRARQRPGWLALTKEPPMRISHRIAVGSPTVRVAAILVAMLLIAALIAGASVAGSRLLAADGTIVVDQSGSGDYTTINEAVAAAKDGDTIEVMPGTYSERFDITADITVAGAGDDPSAVVIRIPAGGPTFADGGAYDPGWVEVDPGIVGMGIGLAGSDAKLSKLTIAGLENGFALAIAGGEPTLDDVVIDLEGGFGEDWNAGIHGGLLIVMGAAPTINRMTHEGWLQIDGGSAPSITDSQIVDSCVEIWGQGTNAQFSDSTIRGCMGAWAFDIADGATALLVGNDISGGGIDVYGTDASSPLARAIIRDNVFHDNGERGVDVSGAATAIIEGNHFIGHDRAIGIFDTDAVIRDNELTDNDIGIQLDQSDATVEDNVITGGTSGIMTLSGGSARLARNSVAGASGNAVAVGGRATPTLVGNKLCGSRTNLWVAKTAQPIMQDNELCPDGQAE